jgi:hypothetical protein
MTSPHPSEITGELNGQMWPVGSPVILSALAGVQAFKFGLKGVFKRKGWL